MIIVIISKLAAAQDVGFGPYNQLAAQSRLLKIVNIYRL